MAFTVSVPFNNNPESTEAISIEGGTTSDTYTVPSGKFARACVTLNTAYTAAGSATNGSANSTTLDIWLAENDVLHIEKDADISGNSAAGSSVGQINAHASITPDGGSKTMIARVTSVYGDASNYARVGESSAHAMIMVYSP